MTDHVTSHIDQEHAHAHAHDDPTMPVDQGAPRGPSAWWLGLLALPIACCALPLLLAAGVTAGSGAVLGGLTGGVLMLAGAAVFVLWVIRRDARSRQVKNAPPTSPSRDHCCSENLSSSHDSSDTSLRE